jgi:hypothetical protein
MDPELLEEAQSSYRWRDGRRYSPQDHNATGSHLLLVSSLTFLSYLHNDFYFRHEGRYPETATAVVLIGLYLYLLHIFTFGLVPMGKILPVNYIQMDMLVNASSKAKGTSRSLAGQTGRS